MDMKELHKALEEQMNFELYSGYIYKQMEAYCEAEDFPGVAHWLNVQAVEEYEHAWKFYEFLHDMDERPEWDAIPKPANDYSSLLDVFEKALEHEKEVTARIHKLVDQAREVDCKRTLSFLQWFVDEQLEEEVTFSDIVSKFERVGNDINGLFFMDAQMAKRQD